MTPAKSLIHDFHAALETATPDTVSDVLVRFVTPDHHWRGMHPFHEQKGAKDVAATFWSPLLGAFTRVQRREDIFFAGQNEIDGFTSTWVISMGHLMGLHDRPFVGIPPTGKIAMLRYAEFNRVVDGKIVETALFCDLLHLMRQAGCYPLPPQTAAHLVQPGPLTHDGLQFHDAPKPEGDKTLALINRMVGSIARNSNTGPGSQPAETPQEELAQDWHDDMIWWGPTGIGATYTIERYAKQHSGPFRAAFYDRSGTGHVARLAEGQFGGFFGWPNFTAKQRGGFMGMPESTKDCEFRVIDIYRRDGDKLAENWIFIDMLYWLMQQGDDVLARMAGIAGTQYRAP